MTRYYMIVRVNNKTGQRIDMLQAPVTHHEACTIASKLCDLSRWAHLRNVFEERSA